MDPSSGTSELGRLLRSWRDRADPVALGLPAGARRAAGLRREELAALAGLSVDYVVRLEQGRASHPSPQVVSAVARALRLDEDESALLHRAAGLAVPRTGIARRVPPSVRRLTERLGDLPLAVFSADWWTLDWNPLWAALHGDPGALLGSDRNLVWREFTGVPHRVDKTPEETERFKNALVADLRALRLDHVDDELTALVEDLRRRSPDFAARWTAAIPQRHRSENKRVDHPRIGRLHLDCDVLDVPGSDVHVIVYSAEPGSESAGRLDLLRVLGQEAFAQ